MHTQLSSVKIGLAMSLLCLAAGVGMGVSFGVDEDLYQHYIASGIAAHPALHDPASQAAIWRWAQRAHFHATGIAAFGLVLIVLVALSGMTEVRKKITAGLIGLGGLYPLEWFVMFLVAPAMGRSAAHHHWLVETLTYVSVGGLGLGLLSLLVGLFFAGQAPEACPRRAAS
ncbi:MAG TPA: hypothetical protein VJ743_08820 [Albitalea sp.]|nr:hypothetical protein [Albitalea sp.]